MRLDSGKTTTRRSTPCREIDEYKIHDLSLNMLSRVPREAGALSVE